MEGLEGGGGGILGGGAVYGPGSENPWHRQHGAAAAAGPSTTTTTAHLTLHSTPAHPLTTHRTDRWTADMAARASQCRPLRVSPRQR